MAEELNGGKQIGLKRSKKQWSCQAGCLAKEWEFRCHMPRELSLPHRGSTFPTNSWPKGSLEEPGQPGSCSFSKLY